MQITGGRPKINPCLHGSVFSTNKDGAKDMLQFDDDISEGHCLYIVSFLQKDGEVDWDVWSNAKLRDDVHMTLCVVTPSSNTMEI